MWQRGHGFPRFKKFGRLRSFVYPQMGINPIRGNKIKLPKIGWVKMRLSRSIPEGFKLKQVRIVKRASGWFALLSLAMEVEVPEVKPHGEPVGIDLGLTSFVATSTGELIPRPRFFVEQERKLKLLQRDVSRKVKGSNNRKKAQQKVARLHQHIYDTRKDFHFKLARYLVSQAGMVFAEELNLKAMSRGMLCKHTLNSGWGQFLNILQWVAQKSGVYFQRLDPNGTSQTCPQCQTHTGRKELSERVHECLVCGYKTNRDVAAAQVVLQRGIVAVGQTVLTLAEVTS